MGKRFTATEKWADKWFRCLTPHQKLGWFYLVDNCDAAGVIDLDRGLADFQIGTELDWDTLLAAAGDRLEALPKNKYWLTGFIAFQYGTLSKECMGHRQAFLSIEKHNLSQRVFKGYSKGIDTLKERTRSKTGQEKDKDKTVRISAADVPVPDGFETPEVRTAIQDWLDFKAKRGESYKDAGYLGRKVAEFATAGPLAFIAAVNSSIGSNYSGLFHAKGNHGTTTPRVGAGQRYRGDE